MRNAFKRFKSPPRESVDCASSECAASGCPPSAATANRCRKSTGNTPCRGRRTVRLARYKCCTWSLQGTDQSESSCWTSGCAAPQTQHEWPWHSCECSWKPRAQIQSGTCACLRKQLTNASGKKNQPINQSTELINRSTHQSINQLIEWRFESE